MCSFSSTQVITPGVESGATKAGHWLHLGYAPTSLHMSSQTLASLFWNCMRLCMSAATHDCSVVFCAMADSTGFSCTRADACFFQPLIDSWPQATKLSMCSFSSTQVITPGVESGATKAGHWLHLGYAPTSLHMSSQTLASLFWNCARFLRSWETHACSSCLPPTWRADACFFHPLSES